MNQDQLKKAISEFKAYLDTDEISTENEELYDIFMNLISKWEKDPSKENLQNLVTAMELHEEMDREIADAHNQTSLSLLKLSEGSSSLTKSLLTKYQDFMNKVKSIFENNPQPSVLTSPQAATVAQTTATTPAKSDEDIAKIIEQLKQFKS